MARERTSRSVRAYARGARIALWLQVFVAAGALLASVWLGGRIAEQARELKASGEALGASEKELEANQQVLGNQLQALDRVQNALRLMAEPIPKNDLAIGQLRAAQDLIGREPSLVRTLAEAQLANDDPSGALATLSALFEPSEDPDAEEPIERTVDDVARLAKYHCAAGDHAAARSLIESAVPEEDRGALLGDDGFTKACSEFAASLYEAAPVPDPGVEFDPASPYKVWNVFPHIRVETDRAAAIALAEGLCDAGYAVPGIELVAEPRPYPGRDDVRFYFQQQQGEAQHVAALVSTLAREAGVEAWGGELVVRPLSGYENLPQDQVELWLTGSGGQSDGAAADGSKRFSCSSDGATRALVERLNDAARSTRLQAGQQVANRVKNHADDRIVGALLTELEPPRLEALTATGRLNVLYMLNLRPRWTGEPAKRLAESLDAIDARDQEGGVKIGGQTRDCMSKLRSKIAGQAAADTCGGL